jgi:hydrogenase maturation protease
MTIPPPILIIGVGNPYRRDDGAGHVAASRIAELGLASVRVLEVSGEGTSLMDFWEDTDCVILIDAVSSGAAPGTIHRLDASEQEIPSDFFHYSTHAFSVAEAVEMARTLGQLPPQVVIYGIEGSDFGAGEGLTERVSRAVEEVVESIRQELECLIERFDSGR